MRFTCFQFHSAFLSVTMHSNMAYRVLCRSFRNLTFLPAHTFVPISNVVHRRFRCVYSTVCVPCVCFFCFVRRFRFRSFMHFVWRHSIFTVIVHTIVKSSDAKIKSQLTKETFYNRVFLATRDFPFCKQFSSVNFGKEKIICIATKNFTENLAKKQFLCTKMAPRRGARKATQPTVQAEAVVADSAIDAAASNGNANKAEKATKATKSAPAAKENAKKAAASKKKGAAEQIEEQHQPENGGAGENNVVEEVSAKVNAKSKAAGTTKKNAKTTEQPTNGDATNGDAPDDGKKRAAKGKQPKADEEVEPPVKKAKAAKGKAKKADQEAVVDIPNEPEPEPAPGPSKVVDKKKGKSAKKIVEPAEVEEEEEEAVVPVEVKGRRGAKKPVVPEKPVEIAKPVKGKAKKAETTKTSARAAKAKQNVDEPADQIDDDVEEKVAPTVAKGRKRGAAASSAVVVEKSPAKKVTSAATATTTAVAKAKANGKSGKRKAGVKAAADSTTDEPDGGLVTKRKKGAKDDANAEAETKMNPTESDLSQIDFETDKEFTLKVVSWNVAGLRALVTKNGMDYFGHEKPDIICLQVCIESNLFVPTNFR